MHEIYINIVYNFKQHWWTKTKILVGLVSIVALIIYHQFVVKPIEKKASNKLQELKYTLLTPSR